MKFQSLIVCALLWLAAPALAQDQLIPRTPARDVVTMAPIAPVTVAPGKPTRVALQFRVAGGYHINSNKPKSDLLIPTTLKLDPPTGISISQTAYPAGEDLAFPFAPDEKLSVYTGDFTISTKVSAAHGTPKGRYRVHGKLISQACDNKACYPPRTMPVAFDIAVGSGRRPHPSQPRPEPARTPLRESGDRFRCLQPRHRALLAQG